MIRIAICDDHIEIIRQIERYISKLLRPKEYFTKGFSSGEELLIALKTHDFDILFLDIQLGGIDGIQVNREMCKINAIPFIICISSYNDRYMDIAETQPFRFLKKPILREKLLTYLAEAIKQLQTNNTFFHYRKGTKDFSVKLSSIIYFESENHHIKIIHQNKKLSEFCGKIDEVEIQLAEKGFVRIHHSILVNEIHIVESSYETVILSNGEQKDISQKKRKLLRAHWISLQERRCDDN